MRLIKLLILLVVMHAGMGFTQMAVSYYLGDIADHGAAGFISHTPIGTFISLDGDLDQDTQANPSNFKAVLDFANNLGDMINGLATFNYGFLGLIESDDGIVYTVVIALRLISALVWVGLGMSLIYFLFDSNLLTSSLGLTLVGLGGAIAALAGFAAVN